MNRVISPLLQWSDYPAYVSPFPRFTEYPVLWYQSVLRKWMLLRSPILRSAQRTESYGVLQKNLSGAAVQHNNVSIVEPSNFVHVSIPLVPHTTPPFFSSLIGSFRYFRSIGSDLFPGSTELYIYLQSGIALRSDKFY